MALKYIGKAKGFLPGAPARDLSDDEVKEYGGVRLLIGTGLYIKAEVEPDLEELPKEREE